MLLKNHTRRLVAFGAVFTFIFLLLNQYPKQEEQVQQPSLKENEETHKSILEFPTDITAVKDKEIIQIKTHTVDKNHKDEKQVAPQNFLVDVRQTDPLHFLVLGDWGGDGGGPTDRQEAVARSMVQLAQLKPISFVVSLGDNIYPHGTADENDNIFKRIFEDVYTVQPSLQVPWYLTLGNHDLESHEKGRAQIAYTKHSKYWKMPGHNYTVTYKIPGSQAEVTIIMFNIYTVCKLDQEPRKKPLDGHSPEVMWKWLEDTLRNTRSEYLLVVSHVPVFTVGRHYHSPCTDWLPELLHKYKVTAYLAGHDHIIEHFNLKFKNWTVQYYVVGLGAYQDLMPRDFKIKAPHIPTPKFIWTGPGGYAGVEVTKSEMTLSFYSSKTKVIYSNTMLPRTNSELVHSGVDNTYLFDTLYKERRKTRK